jgi:Flp pilus assembly protein TadG
MTQESRARTLVGPPRSYRSRHRSRGQSLVEFALVFPIFMLLLVGMIDFGMGLYQYMTVINGARVGARAAVLNPKDTNNVIQNAVTAATSTAGVTIDPTKIVITCTSSPTATPPNASESCSVASTGDTISVTVPYAYSMILPVTFGNTINMTSTAQMAID